MIRGHGIAVVRQPSKLLSRVRLLVPAPLLTLLLLGGCTPSVGVRPSAPLIVTQTVYRKLPAWTVAPCPIPRPSITDWLSVADASNQFHAALRTCSAQIEAIRAIDQPTHAPSPLSGLKGTFARLYGLARSGSGLSPLRT